jgi:hypothetical protein
MKDWTTDGFRTGQNWRERERGEKKAGSRTQELAHLSFIRLHRP